MRHEEVCRGENAAFLVDLPPPGRFAGVTGECDLVGGHCRASDLAALPGQPCSSFVIFASGTAVRLLVARNSRPRRNYPPRTRARGANIDSSASRRRRRSIPARDSAGGCPIGSHRTMHRTHPASRPADVRNVRPFGRRCADLCCNRSNVLRHTPDLGDVTRAAMSGSHHEPRFSHVEEVGTGSRAGLWGRDSRQVGFSPAHHAVRVIANNVSRK